MVPPGPHVISYNSHGSQGDFGPTTAFFIHPTGGQVLVWTWNPTLEMLEPEIEEDKIDQYTKAVQSFQLDANLAPYDLRRYPAWQGLSSHVSPVVIQRLSPIGGNISALYEEEAPPQTEAEVALEKQLAEFKQQRKGKEQDTPSTTTTKPQRCYYTPITRLVKRPGLSPAELTALNIDKSPLLEEIILSNRKGTDDDTTWLLGEFQYSFLAFLLGHSAQGFTQWRAITTLFLGCEDAAIGSRTALFVEFLDVLGAQLEFALGGGSTSNEEDRKSKGYSTTTTTTIDSDAATAGMVGLVDDLLLEDFFLTKLTINWLDNILQLEEGNSDNSGDNNNRCPPELHNKARHLKSLVIDELGWGGKGVVNASSGGRGRIIEVKANEGGTGRRVKGYDSSDEEEGDGEEEEEDKPVFVDPAELVKAGVRFDDGDSREEEDMVDE
jgi:A1 cistron-splicing factor AAR2